MAKGSRGKDNTRLQDGGEGYFRIMVVYGQVEGMRKMQSH